MAASLSGCQHNQVQGVAVEAQQQYTHLKLLTGTLDSGLHLLQ
jgi:hypothetical protein